jgi:hypothetical protein
MEVRYLTGSRMRMRMNLESTAVKGGLVKKPTFFKQNQQLPPPKD